MSVSCILVFPIVCLYSVLNFRLVERSTDPVVFTLRSAYLTALASGVSRTRPLPEYVAHHAIKGIYNHHTKPLTAR